MAHGKSLELAKIQPRIKYIYTHKHSNREQRRSEARLCKKPMERGQNKPFEK